MKNKEQLEEIIADTLANFEDWDTIKSLKIEFVDHILNSHPGINEKLLNEIYERFMQIPAQERFDPRFNHKAFVRSQIEYNSQKS